MYSLTNRNAIGKLAGCFAAAALFSLVGLRPAAAEKTPEFPKLWLNTTPLTTEGLKGKLVVLYYYEENCPRCREQWPERLKVAQKYQDQPVLFVAVNSGNSPAAVGGYLREVGCAWPAIVDLDRSFEKASGVGEISLQNIYQCAIVTPEGQFQRANVGNLDATVSQYVGSAKWKIDPKEVTPELLPLWKSLEVGNMTAAATQLSLVRKELKSEADKAKLKPLSEQIIGEYTKFFDEAKTEYRAGNKWKAYKMLNQTQTLFGALDEAKQVTTVLNKIKGEKEVLRELAAMKKFEENMKLISAPNSAAQTRGLKGMEGLARDFADTEAGQEAQKGLDALPGKT